MFGLTTVTAIVRPACLTCKARRGLLFILTIGPSTRPSLRLMHQSRPADPAPSEAACRTKNKPGRMRPGNVDPLTPGGDLFSQRTAPPVSSALERFTSVFGMGTGGSTPLEPPEVSIVPSGRGSSQRRHDRSGAPRPPSTAKWSSGRLLQSRHVGDRRAGRIGALPQNPFRSAMGRAEGRSLCAGARGGPPVSLHPLPGQEGGQGDGRRGCRAPTPRERSGGLEAKPRAGERVA